ncbi:MAG: VTT domain-containing protein [Candidatus Sumerlaeia bacterium]|nr:VTT domain-containing protein [Candidatus Sumerlaeia bacterium]
MQLNDLMEFLSTFSENPVLQALFAGLSTFILEDPTTISCGLLVGSGHMHFSTALVGLSLGIALGDMGLYWLGRLLGKGVIKKKWLTPEQLERGRTWGNQNLFPTLFTARFIPGARFPTYLTAGVLKVSFTWFALYTAVLSVVWTTLLLTVTAWIGELILQVFGPAKWAIIALLAVAITAYVIYRARKLRRELRHLRKEAADLESDDSNKTDSLTSPTAGPLVSSFERWPAPLFYAPLIPYYIWLSARYGGPMTPFCANPSIYSSGVCKESKSQILSLVPERFAPYMLKRVLWKKPTRSNQLERSLQQLEERRKQVGIDYPFVAKPDLGQRGDGVQLIRTPEQWLEYAERFPSRATVVIQELALGNEEVGIFYVRYPGKKHGKILSVTQKLFPKVVGDGVSTLRELIENDPRASLFSSVYLKRHEEALERVLDKGFAFPLVFSGNHCQGAIFRNGEDLLTQKLVQKIDEIGRNIPGFYFGRFDIRYNLLERLQAGEEFKIVEINGASAESTHIWDANTTLWQAYSALFLQFRYLFQIGWLNRQRGAQPIRVKQFWKDYRSYGNLSQTYPPNA